MIVPPQFYCGAMAGDSKGLMGHPDHVSERTIAITGGDAGYFELMRDCIDSLRATSEGRALSLGVLDCGLTEEQRAWCRTQGAALVVPQWDFDFPGRSEEHTSELQSPDHL